MAHLTSRELRDQFATPALDLASRLAHAAERLEKLEDSEQSPFLPANHTLAKKNLRALLDWLKREVEDKLEGIETDSPRVLQMIQKELRRVENGRKT